MFAHTRKTSDTSDKSDPRNELAEMHDGSFDDENTSIKEEPCFVNNLDDDDENFLQNLINVEHENYDRSQVDLENSGLIKRLISLNQNLNNQNLLKQSIVDLIDFECQSLVKWARLLPDFRMLRIEDQTSSIELNFLEAILIEFIWRSIIYNNDKNDHSFSSNDSPIQSPNTSPFLSQHPQQAHNQNQYHQQAQQPKLKLVMNQNLSFNRSTFKDLDLINLYDHLISIVVRLSKQNFTEQEYLCLKALALFKSDYGFIDVDKLQQLRLKCFRCLKKSSSKACNEFYYGKTNKDKQNFASSFQFRYDSFLLLLAEIKSISISFTNYIVNLNSNNNINDDNNKIEIPALLSNMLDIQRMCGLTTRDYLNAESRSNMRTIYESSDFNEASNDEFNNSELKNETTSTSTMDI